MQMSLYTYVGCGRKTFLFYFNIYFCFGKHMGANKLNNWVIKLNLEGEYSNTEKTSNTQNWIHKET